MLSAHAEYDSALFYLQTTFEKVKKYQYDDLYGDFERNLGEAEAARNHLPAAFAYLHQAAASSAAVEDMQNVSKAFKSIALLYQTQRQPDSAIIRMPRKHWLLHRPALTIRAFLKQAVC